jgi:hypothetical protein
MINGQQMFTDMNAEGLTKTRELLFLSVISRFMDVAVEEIVMLGNHVCLPGLLVEFQDFILKNDI